MEDVTIILQGKTSFEGLDAWTKNGKDLKIVLSTWIDVPIEKFEIPEKWTVIKSPYPERYGGINNLDYQIYDLIVLVENTDKLQSFLNDLYQMKEVIEAERLIK